MSGPELINEWPLTHTIYSNTYALSAQVDKVMEVVLRISFNLPEQNPVAWTVDRDRERPFLQLSSEHLTSE